MPIKNRPIQLTLGLGLGILITNGEMPASLAQETVPVPVTVTITADPPVVVNTSVSNGATNAAVSGGAGGILTSFESTFLAEVCGGLGDPLQAGLDRFAELTEARARATTEAERQRLDREIVLQGLRLPDLVVEDFSARGLGRGQSLECDELIDSVADLMEQVSDYLGALQDAKVAALW